VKKLQDVMTRDVEVVSPEDSLHHAAERMRSRDVGALPVCDGDQLVGMITDRDIVVRSVARGEDPRHVRVAEAMTHELEWCFEDHSLEDVGRHMRERQIRRMLVLNRDKQLVGIVSLGDLATARGNAPVVARTVEKISEPPTTHAAGRRP
jgi:CBS domain-containing protein